MSSPSRRTFLGLIASSSGVLVVPASVRGQAPAAGPTARPSVPPSFPSHDPEVVLAVVGASHGNFARVRELVDPRPALAKVSWDWGFGDWESALGAAAHTGSREIAEYLIAQGARPTIFSAAMMGQVDVVRAFVTASPGVQGTPGPHGITLLRHAEAGGDAARAVVDYLLDVGGADERPASEPLADADRDRLVGSYAFGPAEADRLEVSVVRETLMIRTAGSANRGLRHLGNLVFAPAGGEHVRVSFEEGAAGTMVRIVDGPVAVAGRKVPG